MSQYLQQRFPGKIKEIQEEIKIKRSVQLLKGCSFSAFGHASRAMVKRSLGFDIKLSQTNT